ncbi:uncharacterized protein OCT59_007020 [Rhizophagus irregularis]|uniref:uncharacterized protein n=1 Tax=Rhizophagus irregularis TaxID=588596 RepID=UPI0019F49751|nr:hypothetical protein OCT59_007020 [Rhizophagus irregularis]GBC32676.2 hypothetical protein RIR_jg12068.t1 [Rhizophagus irregularis DAOM 181602=DAOM 197198]
MEENISYQRGNKFTPKEPECACDLYLEWIPFEKFEMVKYVGKGGFSSVYSALWMEGPRWIWDDGTRIDSSWTNECCFETSR